MKRAAAVAAVAALAFPAGAAAHASVTHLSPGARAELRDSPRAIELRFDQPVTVLPNAVRLYDAHGRIVSLRPRSYDGGRGVLAPVRRLPTGAYTVRWQAVSGDGHVVSGVYTFGVRVPAGEGRAARPVETRARR